MFENQILNSIAIIGIFWVCSYFVTFLLRFVEKATSKTSTNLDDKIIKAVKLPIRYLAILLGFFFAFKDAGVIWTIKGKEFGFSDLFFILIIVLIGFTINRILKKVFLWYSESGRNNGINQTMFVFIRKLISVLVYVVIAIIILGQYNIQIGPLLAGLGVAGLAIALGLQETLSNLFAALFLVLDKSININDWIKLEDGTKAFIEDISWRSVRIRTIGGNTVIIPNAKFVGQNISSYDFPASPFYTSVKVGVAYGSDLEKVEYITIQSAEQVLKNEKIKEQDNNPIVRFKEFGESSIDLIVIVKVDKVQNEGRIKHALIKEIAKQFDKNNIEIPFPQRVVEIKHVAQ